ncbi:hypothetical protein PspLS_09899 [Pyricularia sp. CBS 133598]|nr:hypothetical protein PspLS_09899 [Pyricularia sp. CBS 133598]
MGLICLSIFDVEKPHLKTLLAKYENIFVFIQACINVQKCILAGGVLAFTFAQKRWRVNYGLDATR